MDDSHHRLIRGEKSVYDTMDRFRNLEIGEVISIADPNVLGRIKVRIKGSRARGGDDGLQDKELPWCLPMMTKFISVQPKIGESVFIFTFSRTQQFVDRVYIGPIISQSQNLSYDPYITSLAGFSFGSVAPNVAIDTIPQLKGIFPKPEDISIQGRYNTDITQKRNEIVIRAGKFESVPVSNENPYPFTFNKKTQAYIQLKNDVVVVPSNDESNTPQQRGSVINAVASKINLLTHKDGSPIFNLTNQDNLISDTELTKILNEAHQLPFGDVLLEYLRLIKDFAFNHVHNGSGNSATDLTGSGNKQSVATFKAKADELEQKMLSKNIRIN